MLLADFRFNSLNIYFNQDDAEKTIKLLQKIIIKEQINIPIRTKTQTDHIQYNDTDLNNDYVYRSRSKIILYLSLETIGYATYKLEQYLIKNSFFPAELCECSPVNQNLQIKHGHAINIYLIDRL
ncbi:hypothetical protein [Commensalibacter oyaizuii]|uniref:Uncharacterized protein n=1 Tax=Commensalibacter oyaizuii TaxID=3043873 RepID=A0ABT6Q3P6_9PROT|nr:hypothetical protein [Commensalibacter sp. TBRC 16381]MDI2091196.1 hypothetical protein [Commensalibacter sp. TBRC 16381]